MEMSNTENSQSDGTITFYNAIDDTALGVYNNSTANGATIAWSTYSANNNYQKWYLESVAFQRGDVNRDGSFSSADSTLVSQYISQSTTFSDLQQFLADVNGDSLINTKDVLAIIKLY